MSDTDIRTLRAIRNDLAEFAKERVSRFSLVSHWDPQVYNNGQNFRMYGCAKSTDPERVLIPVEFEGEPEPTLADSLVTFVQGQSEFMWTPRCTPALHSQLSHPLLHSAHVYCDCAL